ncbi:hypothetical protein [Cellulomonas sp. NPDC058312]|uniref:hypothetical protein n=1 Tax=Cellulomonas sp. NPDC058312 TaxID=3346441 RepID=UPI0036F111B5
MLLSLLLVVPWVAVNVTQGFEPRSLVLLVFLIGRAALVLWGRRRLQHRPATLGSVAFVVTDDEIRFEPHPSANSALVSAPAEVWPTAGTDAQVRRGSALVGARLVLRAPGRRRRVYLTDQLDTSATSIYMRLENS